MIYLQAEGFSLSLLFPLLMLMVIYFFFMRPQAKRQKQQDHFVQNIAKGDEVVTSSGIIGKINKIDAHSIQLQLDQKTFINIIPGAISNEMTESYNKSKNVVEKA